MMWLRDFGKRDNSGAMKIWKLYLDIYVKSTLIFLFISASTTLRSQTFDYVLSEQEFEGASDKIY